MPPGHLVRKAKRSSKMKLSGSLHLAHAEHTLFRAPSRGLYT